MAPLLKSPENIKAIKLEGVLYDDPQFEGADYVIIDTDQKTPEPDKFVIFADLHPDGSWGKLEIKRFSEISPEWSHVFGRVTQANFVLVKY
jgi:hypothetical protein